MALDVNISRFQHFLTFWVQEPCISSFYDTKCFKEVKKNLGTSWGNMGKYFPWKSETQIFRKCCTMCAPNFLNF